MHDDNTTEGQNKAASGKAPEQQPPASSDEQKTQNGGGKNPLVRRPVLAGALILLFIAAVVLGVLWWLHTRTYESTDDAYIDIQSQFVSPQVSGRVLHVLVKDYQDVTAGDVLIEIDPADYQNRLDQAMAGLAQAQAQVTQAESQVGVYDAQIEQAEANLVVAQVTATNAASDLRRYVSLHKAVSGAVSQHQLDLSNTQAASSAAQVEAAVKAIAAARAQQNYAAREGEAAKGGVRSAQAQVDQAELNISYTKVKARLDGRIANKTVAEGNYVQAGNDLMAVVPTNVYVTANFKETQLTQMRTGQRAEIHVDAYPGMKLGGHVDSIQPGGGQVFSVLPAQNATGNWVKIVQRVPVKIVFDENPEDPARRLAPGFSVEVKVL